MRILTARRVALLGLLLLAAAAVACSSDKTDTQARDAAQEALATRAGGIQTATPTPTASATASGSSDAATPAAGGGDASTVNVSLKEWSVSASPDDEVRQRFQSQAAIFIRHLMVQRDARSLKKLLDWRAMQLSARIPTEKDFANHFGEKWGVWQSKLERYARAAASEPATLAQDGAGSTVAARELGYSFGTGSFSRSGPPRAGGALGSPHSFVFQFTPNERLQTFHRQELASKEVRELYLVAQTLRRRTPVAKATLAQLLRTGVVGPYLPELIAAACQWHGRPNEAVAFSNRLINAGVPNPWLYEFGARVRFDAFLPDIRSSTRLDLQAAIEIRALCEAALEREPRLSDAARMLAWTEALAPEVTPEAVAAADALYQRFKDEAGASELAAALALLQERNGNRQVALTLCRELVKSPQTSARALAVAQELLALEPVTKGR